MLRSREAQRSEVYAFNADNYLEAPNTLISILTRVTNGEVLEVREPIFTETGLRYAILTLSGKRVGFAPDYRYRTPPKQKRTISDFMTYLFSSVTS